MEGKAVRMRDRLGRRGQRIFGDRAVGGIMTTACAMAVAVLLTVAAAAPLSAQTYPSKPIRLILPFQPGGTTDIIGRIIGQKYAERFGQPVVPENRPGAGSNLGIELAAKAKPDGYTMVLTSPALTVSPGLYKKLNYDPVKDLAPISMVVEGHYVLVIRPAASDKEPQGTGRRTRRPIPGNSITARAASERRPISPASCSRASPRSTSCTSRTRGRTWR